MDHIFHRLPPGTIDALKSVFVVLAFIAVTLRLVANWKYNRRLLVDDYISICAIPFLVAVSVLSDRAGNGFHDPESPPYRIAQLAVAISVLTSLALWTCKAPILFLYLRVFGLKKWLRITSSVTLVFIALVYISAIITIPLACTPHTHVLSQEFIDRCQVRTRMTNVYIGSVSVIADVVILILPMPVIFGLKLLVPSRIGLVFLLISGLFAIAAGIISLYFKAMSLKVPATSLAISILATITECAVAVIVGCVPSLRVLWSKVLRPTNVSTSAEEITDVTADRTTNRDSSPCTVVVVEERSPADRKTLDPNAVLVVSTQVRTSTSMTRDDYSRVQRQEHLAPGLYQGQPYYLQAYYRPGREQFDEAIQPPFGVYAEAYALQTRSQRVWGR
ncbi:hypothetical protein GGR50DRAFT_456110 [Xylaria sp. CBS 124048]|nr:hypothetical protein GGR50DRAFT_456110 [Xylaria sp. CBS 124048]